LKAGCKSKIKARKSLEIKNTITYKEITKLRDFKTGPYPKKFLGGERHYKKCIQNLFMFTFFCVFASRKNISGRVLIPLTPLDTGLFQGKVFPYRHILKTPQKLFPPFYTEVFSTLAAHYQTAHGATDTAIKKIYLPQNRKRYT